ncbi:hypothetical protein A3Q56_07198 [Intoshia linei]|uniref:Uncharacterized protein n=1 Tax=Intoshia linei TaxID=1819745 RepID=A0A177AUL9_9BILA|nr:hypothetical protein A3Q56_07198 [Intoshia linei]
MERKFGQQEPLINFYEKLSQPVDKWLQMLDIFLALQYGPSEITKIAVYKICLGMLALSRLDEEIQTKKSVKPTFDDMTNVIKIWENSNNLSQICLNFESMHNYNFNHVNSVKDYQILSKKNFLDAVLQKISHFMLSVRQGNLYVISVVTKDLYHLCNIGASSKESSVRNFDEQFTTISSPLPICHDAGLLRDTDYTILSNVKLNNLKAKPTPKTNCGDDNQKVTIAHRIIPQTLNYQRKINYKSVFEAMENVKERLLCLTPDKGYGDDPIILINNALFIILSLFNVFSEAFIIFTLESEFS